MLFTDTFFLFYFFPLFIIVNLFLVKKIKVLNIFTFVTNIFFYSTFGLSNLPILIIPVVIDFLLGRTLVRIKTGLSKKVLLLFGITLNLSLLFYFKYFFFVSSIFHINSSSNFMQGVALLLAPVGISFLTFQRISYLVDVYHGSTKPEKSFLRYATYDSLFPHIISGPILRYSQIKPQLKKRVITAENLYSGTKLFVIGLAFKVVIANSLYLVESFFSSHLSKLSILDLCILLLYFSLRIYFDFNGYSLMAIGVAKCMGFEFPINFKSPYQSKSFSEFWRRWNITLSSWIRDYLYIPLGGNKKTQIRTYSNLMIAMILAGLWHGANWNFLIWGGLHGTYLVIERVIQKGNYRFRMPTFLKQVIIFIVVTITWGFFKFKSSELITITHAITNFSFRLLPGSLSIVCFTLPFLAISLLWSFKGSDTDLLSTRPKGVIVIVLLIVFALTLLTSFFRKDIPFIYFQF